jgi:Flp pilus assembly protein TadG
MSFAATCHPSVRGLRHRTSRKGATLILALILMTVLIGMLAFTVDVGMMVSSRAELRRTADAAALAGCWQMIDSVSKNQSETQTQTAVASTAASTALLNSVCNQGPVLTTSGAETDVTQGYMTSYTSTMLLPAAATNPLRAVRVRVRRTAASNGAVPYFFGKIFGQTGREITVEATAAVARQVKGFTVPETGNLNVMPFVVDEQSWNLCIAGVGTDTRSYNAATGAVTTAADGIKEVNIFPQGTGAPGNRGTVDIGDSGNSTADLSRQIRDGVSATDLQELAKPLEIPTTGGLTLGGDPGVSAGIKDDLASIIGETRVIGVFSTLTGNGNNAVYTVVRWVGVRVMSVQLTGSASSKHVLVQPATVIMRGTIPALDGTKTYSDSIFSPVVLVQ